MFCPNCGNETSADKRFCRSCGLELEKIAQSLAEQMPMKTDESLQQRKNKFEQMGMVALSVFGLGVLGAIVFGIVYKLMVTQGNVIAGLALLGLIAVFGSGILSVYLFAKAKEVESESARRQIRQAGETGKSETTGELMLEAGGNQMVSVTEGTTELLSAAKRDKTRLRE